MKIDFSERLSTVEEYYFSKKLREIRHRQEKGETIYNLGIGSPDIPPHHSVIRTLAEAAAAADAHHYQSYAGMPGLRQAYSDYYATQYGVDLDPESEILSLIGSKEGIMHLSMAALDPGDEVLVPNPGYGSYAACAKLAGAKPVFYTLSEENQWLIPIDELRSLDTSRVKILWMNYPNMPTGTVPPPGFLEDVVAFARERGILLCNDNPYSTILTEQPVSIFQVPGAKEVACELNSLSKSHNMAGWRVGMMGGPPQVLQAVLKFKSNMDSGKFKAIQLAAIRALGLEKDWYDGLNERYRERQELGIRLLRTLGCTVRKPDAGMFLWARVPATYKDGYAYSDYLLDHHHIFIPPGGIFGDAGDPYIRMSLCTPEDTLMRITDEITHKLQQHAR